MRRAWAGLGALAAVLLGHGLILAFTSLRTPALAPAELLCGAGLYWLLVPEDRSCAALSVCGRWLLAALLSLTLVTGRFLDAGLGFAAMTARDFLLYLALVAAVTPPGYCLFTLLLVFFERAARRESLRPDTKTPARRQFLLALGAILLCWLPVWLAYFPGLWNYDPWQIYQVLGWDYSKHHPLLHTLLLGGCYALGLRLGNPTLGQLLYIGIQLLVMAVIFAYTYAFLCGKVRGRAWRAALLLFFCLLPVHPILALSTTKDTLFSGFVLLSLVLALQLSERRGQRSPGLMAALLVSLTLMLLLRNNAVYALAIFLLAALALTLWRRLDRRVLLAGALAALLFFTADTALTRGLSASHGLAREMFSLPGQLFGRVYFVASVDEEGNVTDPESRALVEHYYERYAFAYNPYLSDPMKDFQLWLPDGPAVYLRDILTLLRRYPLDGLDAGLYLTQGHWDAGDVSHADMYTSLEPGLRGYLQTDVLPGYGLEPDSRLPALKRAIERVVTDNVYQTWPLAPLLFAPASYAWLLLLTTVLLCRGKRWLPFALTGWFWGYYLTLLAGPCALIRYTYPLVCAAPVFLALSLGAVSRENG